MKRRRFVLLTIAAGIAAATPFCKTRRPALTPLNTPAFLGAMCDLQTIRKIGSDYRTTTPDENHEDQLHNLLTAGLDPDKDQSAQLNKKINDDFAAGRTVTIEGWVISVTEARQCALNSIQQP